jgi:transcriptional regulator with XRE-family HTH domain
MLDNVIAARVREHRVGVGGLTQDQLAFRMQACGFGWSRVTVTEIEAGRRRVTVGELVGLSLIFGCPVSSIVTRASVVDLPSASQLKIAVTPSLVLSDVDIVSIVQRGVTADDPEAAAARRLRDALRVESAAKATEAKEAKEAAAKAADDLRKIEAKVRALETRRKGRSQ